MATRTAKGIVSTKDSGTTLTLSNVSVTKGDALFVIVGFQNTGVPTVTAGTRTMNKVIQRVNNTETFGAAIYYIRRLRDTNTRDITATFPASINAKVMAVLSVDIPVLFYEAAGNIDLTASPTTSAAVSDLPVHDCFHLGSFVAAGPPTDVAPTLSLDWNLGQRAGTTGIPPASNITLLEGYKTGRSIDAEEMDSSGSVSRDFCSILATFKPLAEVPAIDATGEEIAVGDTVVYEGGSSTVSSLERTEGNPLVKVVLTSTGLAYNACSVEVDS